MTKKDFELIARVILELELSLGVSQSKLIAECFAGALRGTNPRFDAERFLKACGVE